MKSFSDICFMFTAAGQSESGYCIGLRRICAFLKRDARSDEHIREPYDEALQGVQHHDMLVAE